MGAYVWKQGHEVMIGMICATLLDRFEKKGVKWGLVTSAVYACD